jgi:hypothetical protein
VANNRINSGGWLAIALGVIAGALTLTRVILQYRRDGTLNWVYIVIAIAIPVFLYASVRKRQSGNP